jgi:hypothetical protein
LDRSLDVHNIHKTSGAIERVDTAKLMLLTEYDLAAKYAGRHLEDITLEGDKIQTDNFILYKLKIEKKGGGWLGINALVLFNMEWRKFGISDMVEILDLKKFSGWTSLQFIYTRYIVLGYLFPAVHYLIRAVLEMPEFLGHLSKLR